MNQHDERIHLSEIRRALRRCAASLLVYTALSMSQTAHAETATDVHEPRIALVIANANYALPSDRLSGPPRDAAAVSKALELRGFVGIDGSRKPTLVTDADQKQLMQAVQAFEKALETAGPLAIGFLYYAGHGGANLDGPDRDNYLIPVDVRGVRSADLKHQGVGIRWITDVLAQAGERRAIAIVVDACRDTVPQAGADPGSSKAAANLRMVSPDERQPRGMLVALSTGAGESASDSGIYADVLAAKIAVSGLTLGELFEKVKIEVAQRTGNRQIPEHRAQLVQNACLVSCASTLDADATEAKFKDLARKLDCSSATIEGLKLAVESKNLDRSILYINCKRELLAANDIRMGISMLFHKDSYPASASYLEGLRRDGLGFVADFPKPYLADATHYAWYTPLASAFSSGSVSAVKWLASHASPADLAGYDNLLDQWIDEFEKKYRHGMPLAFVQRDRSMNDELQMLADAIGAGLPVGLDDFRAFRRVFANRLSRQDEQLPGNADDAAVAGFWEAIEKLVQPASGPDRIRVRKQAVQEFFPERIKSMDSAIASLTDLVGTPNAAGSTSRAAGAASRLKDSELVADPNMDLYTYSERGGGPMPRTTVGAVRKQLAALVVRREQLLRLYKTEAAK